ncbi:hypothetical protein [Planomonospora parontospora]|uniref:hypothetical protein n=1 Tax=Planomonospora parontospora TaxID=58119 RepID=UPI001670B86D|nr:hypothetical protein [Planomonospora parontospora]GGL27088.1 hypothetical protein GCM10014719_30770 [Planomonospora parontospora subsp. antibiotica]GII16566.1 hypothetical protein Ppa05_32920 [Planomonospora parontospora subsp. antibiotica]
MHSKVTLVTPELAQEWLNKNDQNRPMSRQFVATLAKAIERGEWQVTHQGIAFSENGSLIDGQHRLAAVVKANMPVEVLVTWNVAQTAFTVMDTGRKRTGRDVLSLANETNSTHLAAAIRGLHLYRTARDAQWSGGQSIVSNDQILKILEENPGMREAVTRGIAINRSTKITITAAAVGWYVTSQERPDVDQGPWLDGLLTGANLTVGDPRLTLRNTMLNLASGKAVRRKDDSREHLLYYLKAWNAWVEGRQSKLLRRSPGEQMPAVSRRSSPPDLLPQ